MKNVIFPGSFDPFTTAHLNILERSAMRFDFVYAAILDNDAKKPAFSLKERMDLALAATSHINNVKVISFGGLLADLYRQLDACAVIRGIRNSADYVYECEMAFANKHLNGDFETIFFLSEAGHSFISSSLVRTIGRMGGDISGLVPDVNKEYIARRLKE